MTHAEIALIAFFVIATMVYCWLELRGVKLKKPMATMNKPAPLSKKKLAAKRKADPRRKQKTVAQKRKERDDWKDVQIKAKKQTTKTRKK